MAAFRSARRGDRHLRWHDWLIAYGVAWLTFLVIGLLLVLPLVTYLFSGDEPGPVPPIIESVMDLTAFGAVILSITFFRAWMFLPSLPFLWLAMRLGLGGWISFVLLGLGYACLVVLVFEYMPFDITAAMALAGALVVRTLLGYERPEAFIPMPR